MQTALIIVGSLLGAASFLWGRTCIINSRLRARLRKKTEKMREIADMHGRASAELAAKKKLLSHIGDGTRHLDKEYHIVEGRGGGSFSVVAQICVYSGGEGVWVNVPVVTCTDEDRDFAFNEATEIMEKLKEWG